MRRQNCLERDDQAGVAGPTAAEMTYAKGAVPAGMRRGHLDEGIHDRCVTNNIGTLATALCATTDDLLKQYPGGAP